MPAKNTVRSTRPVSKAVTPELDPVVVARLTTLAADVLGDQALALRWLNEPILALGGVAPLTFAARRGGVAEVEAVLGRIAYGGYS